MKNKKMFSTRRFSKKALAILLIFVLIIPLAFNSGLFASGNFWGWTGGGTAYTPFAVRSNATGETLGTFCVALHIDGISTGSYTRIQDDTSAIAEKLGISVQALREMRYAIAQVRSNYRGTTFSYENAVINFPGETLSRTMGNMFAQFLVWSREWMAAPSKYSKPSGFGKDLSQTEINYFYGSGMDTTSTLSVVLNRPASEVIDEGFIGPFKLEYGSGSNAALKEINNMGPDKNILPTFSLSDPSAAYIFTSNDGSGTIVDKISIGEEFYIKPRLYGTHSFEMIPNSTIILGVKSESLFYDDRNQPQYSLEFNTYTNFPVLQYNNELEVNEQFDLSKDVTEYSEGTVAGDYTDDDFSDEKWLSPESKALFRMTVSSIYEGGVDVIFADEVVSNPIKIYTPTQLAELAKVSNNSNNYILMNNLDMTNYCKVFQWSPIMNFSGTFDGNGHTISGLTVELQDRVGLFGSIRSSATVKNLVVTNSAVKGRDMVGAIVGDCQGGRIENCAVYDSIVTGVKSSGANTSSYVGGMTGKITGAATIEGCTVKNTSVVLDIKNNMTGIHGAGGLVGGIGNTTGNTSIARCMTENVTVKAVLPATQSTYPYGNGGSCDYSMGGLIGDSNLTGRRLTVTNCYTKGFKNETERHSLTFWVPNIGGLAGRTMNGIFTYCTVENAEITEIGMLGGAFGKVGSVFSTELSDLLYINVINTKLRWNYTGTLTSDKIENGEGAYAGVGGIVCFTGPAKIDQCYAQTDITINSTIECDYAGGIVAVTRKESGITPYLTLTNSMSEGSITHNISHYAEIGVGNTGGLIGLAYRNFNMSNCITTMSIAANTYFVGGVIGCNLNQGGTVNACVAANSSVVKNAPAVVPELSSIIARRLFPSNLTIITKTNNMALSSMTITSNGTPVTISSGLATFDGLSTSQTDLFNSATYTGSPYNYDFSTIWMSRASNYPIPKNVGLQTGVTSGATVSKTEAGSGIWAMGAYTGYVSDIYYDTPSSTGTTTSMKLTTADLLDENMQPLDSSGGVVLVYIPEFEDYSFYYITEALPAGDFENTVRFSYKADTAKVHVTDDPPPEQEYYIDVEKFAGDIRVPLPGSTFTIYRYEDSDGFTGTKTQVTTITPNTQIDTKYKLTEPGYYAIIETVTPDGFDEDATVYNFYFSGSAIIPEQGAEYERASFESSFDISGNVIITLYNINKPEDLEPPQVGDLKVKKIFENPLDSEPVTFTVTKDGSPVDLTADGIVITPSITGSYIAANLSAGKFTLTHNTQVQISGLELGATYVVAETVPENFENPVITGDGTLTGTNGASAGTSRVLPPLIIFTNIKMNAEVSKVSASVSGTKVINGLEYTDKEFTFNIIQVDDVSGGEYTGEGTAYSSSVKVKDIMGSKGFSFTINNLAEGEYYYKITENQTGNGENGWQYAQNYMIAKISVTYNSQTDKLDANVTYPTGQSSRTFTNIYKSDNTTGIVLAGSKTATGKNLIEGQFDFAVFENNNIVARGTNTADGVIKFTEIIYDSQGVYEYTIKEMSLSNSLWQTDSTIYNVTVTVTENDSGILSAYAQYPEGRVVFRNTYTPPDDPKPQNVTIQIRKSLKDDDGNIAGTNKKFAVRLYDSYKNLLKRIILTANSDSVIIDGLESGTTYYLKEEEGAGFTIKGFEIVGVQTVSGNEVGIYIPESSAENINVQIVVNNIVDDIEIIPEEPPLVPVNPPEDPPVIVIPEEPIPLIPVVPGAKTGDDTNMIMWCLVFTVTVVVLGAIMFVRKRFLRNSMRIC